MALKIMQPIDHFIHEKVEHFKQTPWYQEKLEEFNNLEDDKQTLIKSLLTLIAFALPILLVVIMFFIHSSVTHKLETTQDVIATGMRIIEKNKTIQVKGATLFGPPIDTRNALSAAISRATSRTGIDGSKIKIQSFGIDQEKSFNIVSAEIQFNELSNKNFFSFLKAINSNNKFRVQEINLRKNLKSNFLEGSILFKHYSKDNAEFQ